MTDLLGLERLMDTESSEFRLVTLPSGFGMTIVKLNGKPDLLARVSDWDDILAERDELLHILMTNEDRLRLGAVESAALREKRSDL